jgi:hypothetical protein
MDKNSKSARKREAAAMKAVAWHAARAALDVAKENGNEEGLHLASAYQALGASITEAIDKGTQFRIVFQEQEELPLDWELSDDVLNDD